MLSYPNLIFRPSLSVKGHQSEAVGRHGRLDLIREVNIPSRIKQLATHTAIQAFRTIRALKRGLQGALIMFGKIMAPVGRLVLKVLILPLYGLAVVSRLRMHKLALPARGFVLFFITNRYLIHTAIAVLTLVTIVSNLQARQAYAQDVGQKSLLFAMSDVDKMEVVEETVRPEAFVNVSKYLGSATVIGIPHIDFDYEEMDPVTPSLSVPGTIAALPYDLEEEGPKAPRTRTETYVVKENDVIGTIAKNYGVTVGTILWNNNVNERFIRPGDTLKIPPVSGMLVTIKKGDTLTKLASRYGADLDEVTSFNNISADSQLALGAELMLPGGHPPELEQVRTQIATQYTQPKTPSASLKPTVKPKDYDDASLPKTRLLWPTPGHVITQYYGWRHTGLDIDGDESSPLYAAADGVVDKAGWNSGGYGLMLLIKHPNGMMTRYGHASKIFVKAGETVKRGQVIAMMGNTGRSTGSHLHFEVYVNGKRTNPLSYIR